MKTQRIPQMGTVEWSSTREWHKRMVNGVCQCKPCRAELAAEKAAHAAVVKSVLDSIDLEPIGKVGAL